MATLSGIELHLYTEGTRELVTTRFARIVQHGSILYVRSGARGTLGRLRVASYGSPERAARELRSERDEYRYQMGYIQAYATGMVRTDELPAPFVPHDEKTIDPPLARAEEIFIADWATTILHQVTGGRATPMRPLWVAVSGLAAERGKSPAADTLWEYLTSRPHAFDPIDDRLVAQSVHLPHLAAGVLGALERYEPYHDSLGPKMISSALGPTNTPCPHYRLGCRACTQRQAELLAFFARGHHLPDQSPAERKTMIDAAHHLLYVTAPKRVPAYLMPIPATS